ncbi:MAG: hypothetical protein NTU71_04605 [Verrucomicrobia bacterium]|nr:hypothetical protein [Verrucomicrobiota bacterium]
MSDPKPTPPPRNRKARRKSSPGQVAFLEYKAVRDKAKAEREAKQHQDAWYLHHFHPEKAKAKRAKGVKHNAEASAWRRQSFVEAFADWPSVLAAEEMGYRIREWLRDRCVLNPKTGRRKWKWCGCEKNFVKTEASVRKKLTELRVFRYNFRARLWFKCGSVEEAEATQRLAEQEAERRRLAREEAERVERERVSALWEADQKKRQEAERLKAEAEQAERDRLSRPAVAGWHDFIPEELKAQALAMVRRTPCAPGIDYKAQSLDDAKTGQTERWVRDKDGWLRHLQSLHDHDREMRRVAEAVLVAD